VENITNNIDQQIASGYIITLSGTRLKTKLKIHQSATRLYFTWHKGEFDSPLELGIKVRFEGVIGEAMEPFVANWIDIEQVHVRNESLYYVGNPREEIYQGTIGTDCVSISRVVNVLLPNMQDIKLGKYRFSCRQSTVKNFDQKLHDVARQTTLFRSELIIDGPVLPKETYEDEACTVLRLLGVMLSASLYTVQTKFKYRDTGTVCQYWFNTSAGVGLSKVVHSPVEFIESAYPVWINLTPSMRRAIGLASTYLATSSMGYMDTRFLGLFQAWELLSNVYDARATRSDKRRHELAMDRKNQKELACRLNAAYETWRHDFPESNHNEIVNMERLISKSRSIISKDTVIHMIEDIGINREAIEFDINGLRSVSDDVRHNGVIKEENQFGDEFDLYSRNKFALQLIIFKLLGYDGKVWDETGKYRACNPMIFYFGSAEEIRQYEEDELRDQKEFIRKITENQNKPNM